MAKRHSSFPPASSQTPPWSHSIRLMEAMDLRNWDDSFLTAPVGYGRPSPGAWGPRPPGAKRKKKASVCLSVPLDSAMFPPINPATPHGPLRAPAKAPPAKPRGTAAHVAPSRTLQDMLTDFHDSTAGAYPRAGRRDSVHAAIAELCRGLPSAYGIPPEEARAIGAAATYGELTCEGVDQALAVCPPLGEGDVFYDLGSGAGKVCVQVLLRTAVARAVGVELSRFRHGIACDLLQRCGPGVAGRLQLVHGDCLDVCMDDATVVLLCATTFAGSTIDAVGAKLDALPNLRTILMLNMFRKLLANFYLAKTLEVSTSWTPSELHVYHRKEAVPLFGPFRPPLAFASAHSSPSAA